MKLTFYILLLLLGKPLYAQESKLMSSESIKSQVIWLSGKQFFKEIKYKSQELRFDRKGNRTEEIIFNKRGNIVLHKAFEYNKDQLVREMFLDKKGRIVTRYDYRYIGNLLVEKWIYDGKGNKIGNEQFIYEKQD